MLRSLLALAFTITFEGKPVTDAEVCVAQGTGFSARSYTCSREPAVPTGEWTAFARRGPELISDSTGAKELRLVRATRADVGAWPVAEGESRFVYIPRTRSLLPVFDSVPAETLAIPLTLKEGRIVAVGEAASDGRLRVPASTAVVVPVTIERAPEGKSQAPVVTLTDAAGKVHKPVAALSSSAAGTDYVFFRGASGNVTANLEGERWKKATATIEAKPPAVTLGKPLVTTVASKVIVSWWLATDPSVLARETPPCEASSKLRVREREPGKKFELSLMLCRPGGSCLGEVKRELPMSEARGVVEFEGVPAGRYRMRLEYPNVGPLYKALEVTSGEVTRTDFEARWFQFFGKVTKGAKAAHVSLFDTVTDPETGEYQAILSMNPGPSSLEMILPCDGSRVFSYVADEAPAENARYDIEIPSNSVPVDVFDAATGLPIANALVVLSALMEDSDSAAHFAGASFGGRADDKGHVDIGPVLTNRRLMVCAQHENYLRKCADPFRMKGIEKKAIRLDLTKAEKRPGRVITTGDIHPQSMVLFFSPDGSMLERLPVKADGTFSLQKPHGAGVIVGFVSRSHPLYVFALQRPIGESLEIRLPAEPLRSFDVVRAATATELGFYTLAMGNLVIPMQVVTEYVGRRGLQSALPPGATSSMRDIIETGPISVIFVPGAYLRERSAQGRDPVLGFPEGRSLPRPLLGDRPSVTFD